MTEKQLQSDIMKLLHNHPKIAHCWVTTTGQFKVKGGYVTLGYPGISDICGQLRDGRYLAIEVKTKTGTVSDAQQDYIDAVNYFNGLAGVVRSIDDVLELLKR